MVGSFYNLEAKLHGRVQAYKTNHSVSGSSPHFLGIVGILLQAQ